MDENDLIQDSEALGGLTPIGEPRAVPHNFEYDLSFPVQEHRIAEGPWIDPATEKAVNVCSVDHTSSTLVLRRGKASADKPLPRALISRKPLDNWDHRGALQRLAIAVRDDELRFRALRDILSGALPRFTALTAGAPIQTLDLDAQRELARSLDESTLVVQGPPGTGKTWLGARLIVDLIRHGHRVGVTAMSHKAIHNLLEEVERAADEEGVDFRGARRGDGDRIAGALAHAVRRRQCRRVLRSRVRARRRHDVALRARGGRRAARLPRDRRGGSALARRRARRRHRGAQPDPARRPAAAAARLAGRAPRGHEPERPRAPARRGRDRAARARALPRADAAHASGRVRVHLRRGLRGPARVAPGLRPPGRRRRGRHPPPRRAALRQLLVLARGGRHDPPRDRPPARQALPGHERGRAPARGAATAWS